MVLDSYDSLAVPDDCGAAVTAVVCCQFSDASLAESVPPSRVAAETTASDYRNQRNLRRPKPTLVSFS